MTTPPSQALPFLKEYFKLLNVILPTWPVIILFGLFSNTTNIVVFLKSGVRDSVSVLLLSLSMSDLCFLVLMTPYVSSFLILKFAPNWPWKFDKSITAHLLYWPAFTLFDFSAYVSVFLGVTRCACVAYPLHFKSVFTKSRSIIAVIILFVSTILLRMHVLIVHSVGTKINPLTNESFAYLRKHGTRINVLVNDTLNRTSLPWLAFIIMVACVIILSLKLIEASKVRQPWRPSPTGAPNRPATQDRQKSSSHKMSTRDTKVVQSVVLVCIIFILSQLPFLMYSTARLIHPEFDQDTHLVYLFGMSTTISITCSFLNASVNIFIYYKYNTNYRGKLQSMLCCKCRKVPQPMGPDAPV